MREIISQHETYYKNRRIAPVIREIADSLPVVVITGARQVGKRTSQATHGVIVHGGDELFRLHSKVVAVPWWWLDG
jgi:hypothetical protein